MLRSLPVELSPRASIGSTTGEEWVAAQLAKECEEPKDPPKDPRSPLPRSQLQTRLTQLRSRSWHSSAAGRMIT